MAFVTRSERKLNDNLEGITKIGPGEYENEETKLEARILHKISNIYTHASKKIVWKLIFHLIQHVVALH